MEFDIIDLTEEETEMLTTIQLKLLRTAQQNKNKLYHEMQAELETYRLMCKTNNVYLSSLYEDKQAELQAEFDYQVAILKEQLLFNMSLNEPTSDDELGGSGSDDSGYIVDYELSYLERYIIVRDFYLAIEDASERLALYAADETAQEYLGDYYTSLYNYLSTFT